MNPTWYCYILKCADGTYYTGITTDPERRTRQHNESKQGARYTQARRPVELIYCESCDGRSSASQREAQIKKLTRTQKTELVSAALSQPTTTLEQKQ